MKDPYCICGHPKSDHSGVREDDFTCLFDEHCGCYGFRAIGEPIVTRMDQNGVLQLVGPTVEVDEAQFEAMLKVCKAALVYHGLSSKLHPDPLIDAVDELIKLTDS